MYDGLCSHFPSFCNSDLEIVWEEYYNISVQHPFISYYDTSQFLAASSKADLCQAEHLPLMGNKTWQEYTGFQEYCSLSKSSTAILCPGLILKSKNRKVKKINKVFEKSLRKNNMKKKKNREQKEKNQKQNMKNGTKV